MESLPTPGQEVTVSEVARVPGGTAANVAVAAARVLPANAVAFVGALGDDAIAEQQREILHSEAVFVDGIVTIPEAESGQAFILVDADSENVIASALGANALLSPDHFRQPAIRDMILRARSCAITDPSLQVIEEILTITETTECRVSWDPGVLVADSDAVLSLARRVDMLLLNEEESTSLFGGSSPHNVGRRLRDEGWTNRIILKQGGRGATVIDLVNDKLIEVPPLPLTELGMNPANSVGAGDAFHGALAALEAEGQEFTDALLGATAAAGIKVSRSGTRDAPTYDELTQVLAAWRERGSSVRTDAL